MSARSFTIKFNSQKEHDEYCIEIAKRFQKEERIINAADVLNKKTKSQQNSTYRHWSGEEDDVLIEHYGKVTTKLIAKRLNRTVLAIGARVGVLRKLGKKIAYTYEEKFAGKPKMLASIKGRIHEHA